MKVYYDKHSFIQRPHWINNISNYTELDIESISGDFQIDENHTSHDSQIQVIWVEKNITFNITLLNLHKLLLSTTIEKGKFNTTFFIKKQGRIITFVPQ